MTRSTRRDMLALLAASLAASPAVAQDRTPPTTWLPLPKTVPLERIGFGSCLHQRRPQPIWQSILAAEPQLFLMTGDNVYGDVSDASLKELTDAYATLAAHPDFAAARAKVPFLATWDDHDYGLNDASAKFPHKAASRRKFAEFWGVPEVALPDGGVYRSEIFGPTGQRVQVILLDLRSFRSEFAEASIAERAASLSPGKFKPDPSPDKMMLGPAQWIWLEQQLKTPAELRIIVSSTQLLAEGHGFERWGHLPAERDRFFKLIATTAAKGVIVVSGDRHRAAIYKRTADVPYPLYDITSSALNISRAGKEPEDAGRLTPMLGEDNFGLISIDWKTRRVRIEIRRLSGIPADGIDVSFAELGLPK